MAQANRQEASGDFIIEVTDLCKSYGGIRAVDGVSFAIATGEVFGILGPNGAGKTTTVEILEGMRLPDSGTVLYLRITCAGVLTRGLRFDP